jgi:hypothetical protein
MSFFPGFVDTTQPSPQVSINAGAGPGYIPVSTSQFDFSNPIPNSGGVTTLHDQFRNAGTGVGINNFNPINTTLIANDSDTFPFRNSHRQDLTFIERFKHGVFTDLKYNYEVASISELNRYLVSPDGRQRYGVYSTCKALQDDFAFNGVQLTEFPVWHEKENEATFTNARRARMNAITRSYQPKNARLADHHMQRQWIVFVRRRLTLADITPLVSRSEAQANSTDLSADAIVNPHYWCLHLVGGPAEPSPCIYTDDESTGGCMLLGTIIDADDANAANKVEAVKMQQALSGVHNMFKADKGYERLLERSRPVDVFIGS